MSMQNISVSILFLALIFNVRLYVPAQTSRTAFNVGQQTLFLEDTIRHRKLTTEVWYPTSDAISSRQQNHTPFERMPTQREAPVAKGPFPFILFSHGTGGGRQTLEWFCAGLATQGFIVAAVDHYGNTFDNPIPEEFITFWHRPIDLQYVINQVITLPPFSISMDTSKIGAAGFSLGGLSVIALAGAKIDYEALATYLKTPEGKQEAAIPEMPGLGNYFEKQQIRESFLKFSRLSDPRIKSVFAMAPALGQAFPGNANFEPVHCPVYIVGAENDKIAPLQTNASHYAKYLKKAQLTIIGKPAGHYVFLNEASDQLKKQAPLYFTDHPSINRKSVHEKTLRLAVEHFQKTLNTMHQP